MYRRILTPSSRNLLNTRNVVPVRKFHIPHGTCRKDYVSLAGRLGPRLAAVTGLWCFIFYYVRMRHTPGGFSIRWTQADDEFKGGTKQHFACNECTIFDMKCHRACKQEVRDLKEAFEMLSGVEATPERTEPFSFLFQQYLRKWGLKSDRS